MGRCGVAGLGDGADSVFVEPCRYDFSHGRVNPMPIRFPLPAGGR
ncbi:hypothetical protein ATKI12_8758 [Kitasatospora sp. Ki12]